MENYHGEIKFNNTNQGDKTMKAKTINVQIVKNLGNYESIRIGGEWELNGENLQDAIRAAVEELEQSWSKPKAEPKVEPKVEPKAETKVEPKAEPKAEPKKDPDGRTFVRFKEDAKILQAIVTRVTKDKSVTLETVCEHYSFDDDAMKTLQAAIKLRG